MIKMIKLPLPLMSMYLMTKVCLGANGPSRTKNLLSKLYYDPRGKRTVPSGPNCVCRVESGANFDPELYVSGPQPVARGVARDCARTVLL